MYCFCLFVFFALCFVDAIDMCVFTSIVFCEDTLEIVIACLAEQGEQGGKEGEEGEGEDQKRGSVYGSSWQQPALHAGVWPCRHACTQALYM
jgi:hypothetical protein